MYSYKSCSINQCGFRKYFNTQKMKTSRDNKRFCSAILKNLWKAFVTSC